MFSTKLNLIFLTIVLILSTIVPKNLNTKLKSRQSSTDSYTLAVFGDMGQVDYFYDVVNKIKSPTEEETNKWYADNLSKEEYNLTNYGCEVTKNGTKVDLNQKKGLTNFRNIVQNPEVKNIVKNSNGFVILGDVVYPESKFLNYNGGKFGKLKFENKWQDRVRCAWNVFFRELELVNLVRFQKDALNNPVPEFADELEIIAGNHSFDIDVYYEESLIDKIPTFKAKSHPYSELLKETYGDTFINRAKVYTVTPKFITITFKEFSIQFLDYDSYAIACLNSANEAGYLECNKYNTVNIPYADAKKYAWKIYTILTTRFLESSKNRRVWKAMRAHHPPVNSEDGDADFYFDDITTINFQGQEVNVNLWKAMRENFVTLFFGSHIHTAAVIVLPFNKNYVKKPSVCKDSSKVWGCYATKSENVVAENPVFQKVCKDGYKKTLPIKTGSKLAEENYLYVFINGNSGRILDPVKYGKITNGLVLWARSQRKSDNQELYGYSKVVFTRDSVEYNFYEVDPNVNGVSVNNKAATFTVIDSALPDNKSINAFKDTTFCQDQVIKEDI